ncbi:MAG: alcohol dehydrogenase catalytic domain-containing protein, partial [Bacteroidales bacterium]|nr:alcohol dehydrogenase catalytic domain-containing protein [Bacteroidales bacterium]
MKAIITTGYGSPEVFKLDEVAMPTPKANEIRVRIHASSVTKAETMMRTGKPYVGRLFTGLTKPKHAIGGTGFAGVIDAVGPAVTLFKKGERVCGESLANLGTYAEFVCVPEDGIVAAMPDKITFSEAAGIG